jgi:Domain of unknown function (DUF4440)
MLAGDVDELRAVCHPQLTYTHSNAERDSLGSWLRKVEEGHFTYLKIDHAVESVAVEGGCAVVIGSMRASVEVAGTPREIDNSACAVWAQVGDDWKLLAYQPTPYPRGAQ